jgi:phage recombination protein Bet
MSEETQLIERDYRLQFDRAEIELIKSTVAVGASDLELKLFVAQCKRTGLDPFAKQIYAVKRWNTQQGKDTMSIQIAIDGYRLIAERTGKYAGQLGPYWCGKDAQWVEVWLDDKPPLAAKVGVIRHDFKEPIWVTAKYSSFVQTKKDGTVNHFWKIMPEVMLAKVAESQALRKAFPQDLSGTHTEEEANGDDFPPSLTMFEEAMKALVDCKSKDDLINFKLEYDKVKSRLSLPEQEQITATAKEVKAKIDAVTVVVVNAEVKPEPTAAAATNAPAASTVVAAATETTPPAEVKPEDPVITETKLSNAINDSETMDQYAVARDQLKSLLAAPHHLPEDAVNRLKRTAATKKAELEKKLASQPISC